MPFLPLFGRVSGVLSSRTLDSSRFAGDDNLTFWVMGGKNGKIAARNGNDVATDGKVGGKRGKDGARVARYGVVKVLAARDGTTYIELNYHNERRVSRRAIRAFCGGEGDEARWAAG